MKKEPPTMTPEERERRRKRIWNGWTWNYCAAADGYITHAFDEDAKVSGVPWRSLCGVRMRESGWLTLGHNARGAGVSGFDHWTPGCIRCRRALIKRGLMAEDER